MRKIDKIIIHCSGTSVNTTFESILNYHKNILKWSDIGYHYVISFDGKIYDGRPVEIIGAHCLSENDTSIGICLIGGLHMFDFSFAQMLNLLFLLIRLCDEYKISKDNIFGHYVFNPKKKCPCFNVKNFLHYEKI